MEILKDAKSASNFCFPCFETGGCRNFEKVRGGGALSIGDEGDPTPWLGETYQKILKIRRPRFANNALVQCYIKLSFIAEIRYYFDEIVPITLKIFLPRPGTRLCERLIFYGLL